MKPSLKAAREVLAGSRRVVSFSGAGLSAESGLATFRDADNDALWSRFDPAELASLAGFENDPLQVSAWYQWRRKRHAAVTPNAAHRALASQVHMHHVTQNVDSLLELAGARPERVHHLHGTIMRDHCHARCGYGENVDLYDPPALRPCPQCGQSLRPAVVWFGEPLPVDTWNNAERLCREADCLLVVGTSARVYPAAGLIALAASSGGRLIIVNTRPQDAAPDGAIELLGPAGELLPELLDGMDVNRPG